MDTISPITCRSPFGCCIGLSPGRVSGKRSRNSGLFRYKTSMNEHCRDELQPLPPHLLERASRQAGTDPTPSQRGWNFGMKDGHRPRRQSITCEGDARRRIQLESVVGALFRTSCGMRHSLVAGTPAPSKSNGCKLAGVSFADICLVTLRASGT